MKLKWFGTATILLEQDGTRLLFDPFLSLSNRGFKPPMDELAAINDILVTHGHFDHISDIPAIWKHGKGKAAVCCTAKPREVLISKGVAEERVREIAPGDVLSFGPFCVRVLKGKHIVYDKWLLIKTLVNPRVLVHWNNFKHLLKENRLCDEAGETVVYDITVSDKRVLLMGSLNLDDSTEYPKEADLVILPFQGRSDIGTYAMPLVHRLQPKKLLLDHFDDTFPPVSSSVNTGVFLSSMRRQYPNVPVICQRPGVEWMEAI